MDPPPKEVSRVWWRKKRCQRNTTGPAANSHLFQVPNFRFLLLTLVHVHWLVLPTPSTLPVSQRFVRLPLFIWAHPL
ncbi:hypothetical protein M426DRAFT_316689 [Hypoxylon sp. CI-4A]|nr:hypothetical protein M426DRAFT_316689 [Hypoxylon sp. CI-4A]